ncbi:hypothetical protein C8R43DRAFT_953491 [Mycena crocata]|nr:hypothetical protein C8R43DRAFT_953491 [Mycena crocata]
MYSIFWQGNERTRLTTQPPSLQKATLSIQQPGRRERGGTHHVVGLISGVHGIAGAEDGCIGHMKVYWVCMGPPNVPKFLWPFRAAPGFMESWHVVAIWRVNTDTQAAMFSGGAGREDPREQGGVGAAGECGPWESARCGEGGIRYTCKGNLQPGRGPADTTGADFALYGCCLVLAKQLASTMSVNEGMFPKSVRSAKERQFGLKESGTKVVQVKKEIVGTITNKLCARSIEGNTCIAVLVLHKAAASMPAVRNDANDFELILNNDATQPHRMKCLVCSTETNTKEMAATSVAKHRPQASALMANQTTETFSANVTPAVLSLVEQFLGFPSDDSDEENGYTEGENPFDEAGSIAVNNSLDSVWKDIKNLDYYDHTVFADMSPLMVQLLDQTDDSTVKDAVAAMDAIGIEDSDDEEEGLNVSATASDFDSQWVPHRSKTTVISRVNLHAWNFAILLGVHPLSEKLS